MVIVRRKYRNDFFPSAFKVDIIQSKEKYTAQWEINEKKGNHSLMGLALN